MANSADVSQAEIPSERGHVQSSSEIDSVHQQNVAAASDGQAVGGPVTSTPQTDSEMPTQGGPAATSTDLENAKAESNRMGLEIEVPPPRRALRYGLGQPGTSGTLQNTQKWRQQRVMGELDAGKLMSPTATPGQLTDSMSRIFKRDFPPPQIQENALGDDRDTHLSGSGSAGDEVLYETHIRHGTGTVLAQHLQDGTVLDTESGRRYKRVMDGGSVMFIPEGFDTSGGDGPILEAKMPNKLDMASASLLAGHVVDVLVSNVMKNWDALYGRDKVHELHASKASRAVATAAAHDYYIPEEITKIDTLQGLCGAFAHGLANAALQRSQTHVTAAHAYDFMPPGAAGNDDAGQRSAVYQGALRSEVSANQQRMRLADAQAAMTADGRDGEEGEDDGPIEEYPLEFEDVKAAVLRQDVRGLRRLLGEANGQVEALDVPEFRTRRTVLMIAAQKGLLDSLRFLASKGCDALRVDAKGHNALHYAVECEKGDAVGVVACRLLVQMADGDPSARISKITMSKAEVVARLGLGIGGFGPAFAKAIRKFMSAAARSSHRQGHGAAPIHLAIRNRRKETLRYLLSLPQVRDNDLINVLVDAETKGTGRTCTALHLAVGYAGLTPETDGGHMPAPTTLTAADGVHGPSSATDAKGGSGDVTVTGGGAGGAELASALDMVQMLCDAGADPAVTAAYVSLLEAEQEEGEYDEERVETMADDKDIYKLRTTFEVAQGIGRNDIAEVLAQRSQALAEDVVRKDNVLRLSTYVQRGGADIDMSGPSGRTLLMNAATAGAVECLRFLLRKRARADTVDPDGCNALHYACAVTSKTGDAVRWRSLQSVKALLDRSVEGEALAWVQNESHGMLPVHTATMANNVTVVDYLVERFPQQIGEPMNLGDTLLHIAAGGDSAEALTVLLARGADVALTNDNDETPLKTAVGNECAIATDVLLQYMGTSALSALRRSDLGAVQVLLDAGFPVNHFDGDQMTLLMHAASLGLPSCIGYLLERGALEAIDFVDGQGASALTIACTFGSEMSDENLERPDTPPHSASPTRPAPPKAQSLRDKGESENGRDKRPSAKQAALTVAVEMAKLLVETYGARVDMSAFEDQLTPLHVAVISNNVELAQFLTRPRLVGRLYNAATRRGDCAMHIAAEQNNIAIVSVLLEGKESPSIANQAQLTPAQLTTNAEIAEILRIATDNELLLKAAGDGNFVETRALVHRGVNINCTDFDNLTPLGVAARNMHLKVLNHLVFSGAKVNATDWEGRTPLHWVASVMHSSASQCAQILIDVGRANPNLRTLNEAYTPLHEAALSGNVKVLNYLLARVDREPDTATGMCPSAFMLAVEKGNSECVQGFLTHSKPGDAVVVASEIKNALALAVQLEHKATSRVLQVAVAHQLRKAVKGNDLDGLTALLEVGADPNALPLNEDQTLLMLAAAAGQRGLGLLGVLLRYGARVDRLDAQDRLAMHHAALAVDGAQTVEMLLSARSVTHVVTKTEGYTPLHCAVKVQNSRTVELLLGAPDRVYDAKDATGATPMHLAASMGATAIVWLLLEEGEDLGSCDGDNLWPYEVAVRQGHESTAQLLKRAMEVIAGIDDLDAELLKKRDGDAAIQFNSSHASTLGSRPTRTAPGGPHPASIGAVGVGGVARAQTSYQGRGHRKNLRGKRLSMSVDDNTPVKADGEVTSDGELTSNGVLRPGTTTGSREKTAGALSVSEDGDGSLHPPLTPATLPPKSREGTASRSGPRLRPSISSGQPKRSALTAPAGGGKGGAVVSFHGGPAPDGNYKGLDGVEPGPDDRDLIDDGDDDIDYDDQQQDQYEGEGEGDDDTSSNYALSAGDFALASGGDGDGDGDGARPWTAPETGPLGKQIQGPGKGAKARAMFVKFQRPEIFSMVRKTAPRSSELKGKAVDLEHLLQLAIEQGDVAHLEVLIRKGANVNYKDADGQSVLALALRRGMVEVVTALLDAKASADVEDRNGITPLHLAVDCYKGVEAVVVVRSLLQQGEAGTTVDKHRNEDGNTPMHLAVIHRNAALVDVFGEWEGRKERDSRNLAEDTPLHIAVKLGDIECVLACLKAGENPNAMDGTWKPTMTIAHELKHGDIASLIQSALSGKQLVLPTKPEKPTSEAQADAQADERTEEEKEEAEMKLKENELGLAPLTQNDDETDVAFSKRVALRRNVVKKAQTIGEWNDLGEHITDFHARMELVDAVCRGDFEDVKRVLQLGVAIDTADDEGMTPLMISCSYGDIRLPVTETLLFRGASVHRQDKTGATALHHACAVGDLGTVKVLIETAAADTTIVAGPDRLTPLHYAVDNGSTAVVKYLIERPNYVPNQATITGDTALHIAAAGGSIAMLKVLLDHEEDVCICNHLGVTALTIAIRCGHEESATLVQSYMQLSAERATLDENMDVIEALLRENAIDQIAYNAQGLTMLMFAAVNGKPKPMRRFIESGADVSQRDESGIVALHHAVTCPDDDAGEFCVRILCEVGLADPNQRTLVGGFPALHLATMAGNTRIVRYLLSLDAVANNVRADNGESSLHLAAKLGHLSTIEALLNGGEDIAIRDSFEQSVWDVAVSSGHPEVAETLSSRVQHFVEMRVAEGDVEGLRNVIRCGGVCPPELLTEDGMTMLMVAASCAHVDMCRYLIQMQEHRPNDIEESTGMACAHYAAGADDDLKALTCLRLLVELGKATLDVQTRADNEAMPVMLPLHCAAVAGNTRVLYYIMEQPAPGRGSWVDVRTGHGDTALHIAAAGESLQMINLLIDTEHDVGAVNDNGHTPFQDTQQEAIADRLRIQAQTELSGAVRDGKPGRMAELLRAGGNIDGLDENGDSLLHIVVKVCHVATALQLVRRGARIDIRDKKRRTPLHAAAFSETGDRLKLLEICRILVEVGGADLDGMVMDGSMFRAVHCATLSRQCELIAYLLERPTHSRDVKSTNGNTALHLAASRGYLDACTQLVESGERVGAVNDSGHMPIDLAMQNEHEEVIKYLETTSTAHEMRTRKVAHALAMGIGQVCVLKAYVKKEARKRFIAEKENQIAKLVQRRHWGQALSTLHAGILRVRAMMVQVSSTDEQWSDCMLVQETPMSPPTRPRLPMNISLAYSEGMELHHQQIMWNALSKATVACVSVHKFVADKQAIREERFLLSLTDAERAARETLDDDDMEALRELKIQCLDEQELQRQNEAVALAEERQRRISRRRNLTQQEREEEMALVQSHAKILPPLAFTSYRPRSAVKKGSAEREEVEKRIGVGWGVVVKRDDENDPRVDVPRARPPSAPRPRRRDQEDAIAFTQKAVEVQAAASIKNSEVLLLKDVVKRRAESLKQREAKRKEEQARKRDVLSRQVQQGFEEDASPTKAKSFEEASTILEVTVNCARELVAPIKIEDLDDNGLPLEKKTGGNDDADKENTNDGDDSEEKKKEDGIAAEPYVVVTLGKGSMRTSASQGGNPHWGDEMTFTEVPDASELVVEVFDKTRDIGEDAVGSFSIPVAQLHTNYKNGHAGMQWFELARARGPPEDDDDDKPRDLESIEASLRVDTPRARRQRIFNESMKRLWSSYAGTVQLKINLVTPEFSAARDKARKAPVRKTDCVFVAVMEARGLPPKNADGLVDAFATVNLDDKHEFTTRVVRGDLHPKWHEECFMQVPMLEIEGGIDQHDDSKSVVVELYSQKQEGYALGANRFLGQVSVPVRDIRKMAKTQNQNSIDNDDRVDQIPFKDGWFQLKGRSADKGDGTGTDLEAVGEVRLATAFQSAGVDGDWSDLNGGIECSNDCGVKLPKDFLHLHLSVVCVKRLAPCKYKFNGCTEIGMWIDMPRHEDICAHSAIGPEKTEEDKDTDFMELAQRVASGQLRDPVEASGVTRAPSELWEEAVFAQREMSKMHVQQQELLYMLQEQLNAQALALAKGVELPSIRTVAGMQQTVEAALAVSASGNTLMQQRRATLTSPSQLPPLVGTGVTPLRKSASRKSSIMDGHDTLIGTTPGRSIDSARGMTPEVFVDEEGGATPRSVAAASVDSSVTKLPDIHAGPNVGLSMMDGGVPEISGLNTDAGKAAMASVIARASAARNAVANAGASNIVTSVTLNGCHGQGCRMAGVHGEPLLASFSEADPKLKIWDTNSLKCVRTFTRCRAPLNCVMSTPEWGGLVFTGGSFPEDVIKVWDVSAPGSNPVMGLGQQGQADAFHTLLPMGRRLASGDESAGLCVWDVQGQVMEREIRAGPWGTTGSGSGRARHTHAVLSLATDDDNTTLYSGSADQTVKVWDPRQWEVQHTLTDTRDSIKSLLRIGYQLIGAGEHSMTVWDVRTLGVIKRLQGRGPVVNLWGRVYSSASDESDLLKAWDISTWENIASMPGHVGAVHTLTAHRGSLFSASEDGDAKVWKLPASTMLT